MRGLIVRLTTSEPETASRCRAAEQEPAARALYRDVSGAVRRMPCIVLFGRRATYLLPFVDLTVRLGPNFRLYLP